MSNMLQGFEQFDGIRQHVDEEGNKWYCVVDVIEILSASKKPRDYGYRLKVREKG